MKPTDIICPEPRCMTRQEIMSDLQSEDVSTVLDALLCVAFYEEDYDFSARIIYDFAQRSTHPNIRGLAILCIGHMARIHGVAPEKLTIEIIEKGLKDSNDYVRGHANFAAGDLRLFIPHIGKQILGYTLCLTNDENFDKEN